MQCQATHLVCPPNGKCKSPTLPKIHNSVSVEDDIESLMQGEFDEEVKLCSLSSLGRNLGFIEVLSNHIFRMEEQWRDALREMQRTHLPHRCEP